jgi:hypothetical protein
MMRAIFYSFNVMNAGKNMKTAVARNARILFICRLSSKRNCAKASTKDEMYLTNQEAG